MIKISTGQDSTLKTYKEIAHVFGKRAEAFIDESIAESPHGENEEVIMDERQMLQLFASMLEKSA